VVLVVIGPSGSGRSTLCRTVNRHETIDSGTITIDRAPIPAEGRALARLRADVGMVFQSFNLFAHKTVRQDVTLGQVEATGVAPSEAKAAVAREVLERVGVADQADKLQAQLRKPIRRPSSQAPAASARGTSCPRSSPIESRAVRRCRHEGDPAAPPPVVGGPLLPSTAAHLAPPGRP
jgi:ABC-type histidine transport system ATPase subunit